MHDYYMNIALKQATIAYKNNEVPIGCVIVNNGQVIAKAYNKKEKTNNSLMHAEIIALNKAIKKLKTWHLENCIIYCTVEPCVMCIGAISQCRISTIIYGASNEKFGYTKFLKNENKIMNNNIKVVSGICRQSSERLLKKFFEEKRI